MDQASRLRELISVKNRSNNFRVITVASGKGGVGKTNFVVNLASCLSIRGLRVAIFDADFGMANVDILFGVKSNYSIYDVIYNNLKIQNIISTTSEGVKIIPGGSGIKELSEISDQNRQKLIGEFSQIENIDILLVDTGAGISKNVLNFVEIADDVIVLTNPEPTALTDAYGLIKIIKRSNLSNNINVIINRTDSIREANENFQKLARTAEAFLETKLEYLGFIPEDSKVGQAVKSQNPFYVAYPKCAASLCLETITSKLLGTDKIAKNKSAKDFFNKLLNIMGRK